MHSIMSKLGNSSPNKITCFKAVSSGNIFSKTQKKDFFREERTHAAHFVDLHRGKYKVLFHVSFLSLYKCLYALCEMLYCRFFFFILILI